MSLPPQGLSNLKRQTYYCNELTLNGVANRICGISGEEGAVGSLDFLEVFASRPTRIVEVSVDVRTNTCTEDINIQLTVDGAGNNSPKHVVATVETGIVRFTNEDLYWGDYTLEQAWAISFLAEATNTGEAKMKVTVTVEYLD